MMIWPAALHGVVEAPASKSDAHRLLILSALADKPTEIDGFSRSDDIDATLRCLWALGARLEDERVMRPVQPRGSAWMFCGQSGTTLRFLLPVVTALGVEARFMGDYRLQERPMRALVQTMRDNGAQIDAEQVPLTAASRLRSGNFVLPGDISSQFVSGLLLALPLMDAGGIIQLSSPLESAGYVRMTQDAMEDFSVMAIERAQSYLVPGNQRYRSPGRVVVERDWSAAAFWLVAGAIGGGVTVRGLSAATKQPDQEIVPLLRRFGAEVEILADGVRVSGGAALRGVDVDISQTPDLAPALAVLGMMAEGTTRLTDAGRLRLKECDRLAALRDLAAALGGAAQVEGDMLRIEGGRPLAGGEYDAAADHRMAMAAAVAATRCADKTEIIGADSVNKSYPRFFEDFARLGGECHGIDAR